ncbi:MAG: hypothetical protein IJZ29_00905 [Clostridia bacterium]|nr:hypothetical protein [Clostridia bacterium]
MRKLSILTMAILSVVCFATGCNETPTLNTQGAINLVQSDMTNIATTIRSLDNLYLEDYAISELSPLMNYSSYNNMDYSTNNVASNNVIASVSAEPYSETYNLNYSYSPKYIENINSLDTSSLIAYIQSMQDLFLITSDITAANQLLNELTYSIINDTINVRNNAYLLNYNMNELTEEQIAVLQEYSTSINNLLENIKNTSGYVSNELENLIELRDNFYKNAETLNAKYINMLNILENRIVQLQNIQIVLERLNNQLILMSDVNTLRNNLNNNYESSTQSEENFEDSTSLNTTDEINQQENMVEEICHDCQICDSCENCIECDICKICPSCELPSKCIGDCGNFTENNDNNLNNNAVNNYKNYSNNYVNNELNNVEETEFCHDCMICNDCNSCTNCDICENCEICDLPSSCNGNCNSVNDIANYGINNNNLVNNETGINDCETGNCPNTLPNPTQNNNNLLNNNTNGYSNYNGANNNPIINDGANLNYEPYSIY